jgi:hypothetical protein
VPRPEHQRPEHQRREFRHGFRPGKLIAGIAVLTATLLYAGDAAGSWQTPWFAVFPVVFGGLFLAGAATWTHYRIRRRRCASSESREKYEAPASSSGSQAIR